MLGRRPADGTSSSCRMRATKIWATTCLWEACRHPQHHPQGRLQKMRSHCNPWVVASLGCPPTTASTARMEVHFCVAKLCFPLVSALGTWAIFRSFTEASGTLESLLISYKFPLYVGPPSMDPLQNSLTLGSWLIGHFRISRTWPM